MLQKKEIETVNSRVRLRKNKGSGEGAQVKGEGPNYCGSGSLSHEGRSGDDAEMEEILTRRGHHTTRNTLGVNSGLFRQRVPRPAGYYELSK